MHRLVSAALLALVFAASCAHAQVFHLFDGHCGEKNTPCCKGKSKKPCKVAGHKCSADDICRDCGLEGQWPCQQTNCHDDLTVFNGICQSGKCGSNANWPCCKSEEKCGRGLQCVTSRAVLQLSDSGRCLPCGGDRQPVCSDNECAPGHVSRKSDGKEVCYHAPAAGDVKSAPEKTPKKASKKATKKASRKAPKKARKRGPRKASKRTKKKDD